MKYTSVVDPFLGNGEIGLPEPTFPASTWHFIKGLSGNTAPAAVLPFGKYSCMGYSGGYPHGYGVNTENCGGPVGKIFDKPHLVGLSHFHHNGTGAVGVYYNYCLTYPYTSGGPDFIPRPVEREQACPGYFGAQVAHVLSEATVSTHCAAHRYTFDGPGRIAIDFANDGLHSREYRMRGVAQGTVTRLSDTEIGAQMILQGLKLWFRVRCIGGRFLSLFREGILCPGTELILDEPMDVRLGGIFQCGNCCELRVAVSLRSDAHAAAQLDAEPRTFDQIRQAAGAQWEQELAKIEIDCDDSREREIFYSNLYHTLVKPCDWSGEAFPLQDPAGTFLLDIVTMWDIYKTQLPLLFSVWPQVGSKLLKTLERFCREYGKYIHSLILSNNLDLECKQGRMLAEYSICDAYYRGVPADYPSLLALAKVDGDRFDDYPRDACQFASHTLDMGEAYASMAPVARALGLTGLAEEFRQKAERVWSAFASDGIMRPDSDYYEGNRYNYSFRCVHDMPRRLAIAGIAQMEREAERFFGFRDGADVSSRFEGFNNETDMEAPYFLHAIGRRDLLCQVIVSGIESMFTTGKGGIPGNADCGGLTSCYLWNALGIFPISGQDRMIIGTPRYTRAVLHQPGGDFVIRRVGEGICPVSATLNGETVEQFEFPASRMVPGGELVITMGL